MPINNTTIQGNLVRDPEHRHVNDKDVTRFTVAINNRRRNPDTGEWEDGRTDFIDCQAWGNLAKMVGDLKQGTPVIVNGELRQNSWVDDTTQQKRSRIIVNADGVAVDAKFGAPKLKGKKKSKAKPAAEAQTPNEPASYESEEPF